MVFVEVIISLGISVIWVIASGIVFKELVDVGSDDLSWWGTLKLLETLFVAYVVFNRITK